LGLVSCSLRGNVTAGSYQTCKITYTAGFAGIDDTGSLKFVMRYPTDAAPPQFDNPSAANYTTASASNNAILSLRYDVKDNVRPWGKTILVKVVQGYLRRGDRIVLTLGDRTGGSPGWRVQTFAQKPFQIRVLVDRYATYVHEPVPNPPTFRIVAGKPVKLVAVAPSLVQPRKKFRIRTKAEDGWGNPVGRARTIANPGFAEPGCRRVEVKDEQTKLKATTNPILIRDCERYGRYWADLHGQSEETIGTNSVEDYFRFARDLGFVDIASHQGNDFQITDGFWRKIQETTRRYNKSGRFVAFPGWEWSGNTGLGGDRNVVYRSEGGPIHRSSRALVGEHESVEAVSPDVEDLFRRLRGRRDVMLIPHVGGRYADIERFSEALEPVVEVHSAWGTFEWMLEDACKFGYRVGVVANSDGHKGRPGASYPGAGIFGSYGGLTCVLAESLDRDTVWRAYRERRVYATTGARILLDVSADGGDTHMGSVVHLDRKDEPPSFEVSVHGTAPIERVEFRNGSEILKTVRNYDADDLGSRVKVLWQGAEVRGRGRQVRWDGGLRVDSNRIRSFRPINFYNLEQACARAGPRALEWRSQTTGGVAGVIVNLEKPQSGQLHVSTEQKRFGLALSHIGLTGRTYRLGGLEKRISAYRLPSRPPSMELAFRYRPPRGKLHSGDNPLYVKVVQEDGHMAWSSPIYVVAD
jgi:hypothetical protein